MFYFGNRTMCWEGEIASPLDLAGLFYFLVLLNFVSALNFNQMVR